jgi:type I restriction enzyme S subunit
MANDWINTNLGSLLSFSNGKNSLSRSENSLFPVYGSNGIIGYCDGYNTKGDSIIIGRVGTYCGSVYHSSADCWVTDNAIKAIAIENNSPLFLYYLLKDLNLNNWREGSGQPLINQTILKNINVAVPSPIEQKAIAHILGSLDDKIELNRQMNETLEAMAQALFKSWFVDFDPVIDNALAAGKPIPDELSERAEQRKAVQYGDNQAVRALFPDEFVLTEEMGWIPKGWEVRSLGTLIELTGGGTPKTTVDEYWNGDIPWFSVVDAPSKSDVFVLDTEKHVTRLGVENSSTKILPIGTTIISARGTVGKCAMVSRPTAMNQSCYGVNGKDGIANIFVYFSVLINVSELQNKGHGSVFNTITGNTFNSINMPFSDKKLTIEFDKRANPLFEKILANNIQRVSLSKVRDTLLPKLLSGELRIPDAAALVEDI